MNKTKEGISSMVSENQSLDDFMMSMKEDFLQQCKQVSDLVGVDVDFGLEGFSPVFKKVNRHLTVGSLKATPCYQCTVGKEELTVPAVDILGKSCNVIIKINDNLKLESVSIMYLERNNNEGSYFSAKSLKLIRPVDTALNTLIIRATNVKEKHRFSEHIVERDGKLLDVLHEGMFVLEKTPVVVD